MPLFTTGDDRTYERMMKIKPQIRYTPEANLNQSMDLERQKKETMPPKSKKKRRITGYRKPSSPRKVRTDIWHSWEDGEKHGSHPR